MKDVKALFLGPKAENQELYGSLISEIVSDSCFLRKNFHPEDDPLILETDKLQDSYRTTLADLRQHLQNVLSELKKGVPWYHPRYIGHMFGDLMLPAIAGYFGAILYNPNNVVGEVSTATTKMELDYVDALCRMVGYKRCLKLSGQFSWGHLCSGGTSANIEALWVARNMKYYPLSVKLAYESNKTELSLIGDIFINFFNKDVRNLSFSELFNLPPSEILDLKDKIYQQSLVEDKGPAYFDKKINDLSVVSLGVYGIHNKIREIDNHEVISLPRVYVAKSSHYSWEKAVDIIGIGQNQLIHIDVDEGYRLDMKNLREHFSDQIPTLAIIGIFGSSKQGSIDPIDEIIDFRKEKEKLKNSFVVHIDAAYGGYFLSTFWKGSGSGSDEEYFAAGSQEILEFLKRKDNDLFRFEERSTVNEKWVKKIRASQFSESFTVDPHKMGYVPYPAGGIVFSDTRMKEFISYTPSYLNKPKVDTDLHTAFLGQWTLEGSRPGATAASCYLSNKVMPFYQEAHGLLIKHSMHAADIFWETIQSFNDNHEINKGFRVISQYIPETNIVSYVITSPGKIRKTRYLNFLNERLYNAFTVKGDTVIPAQDFIVAKDAFDFNDIPPKSLFAKCGINEEDPINQIKTTVISSVFMNPLSVYQKECFYMHFWEKVVQCGLKILPDIILEILYDERNKERIKVLWIEDDSRILALKNQILQDYAVGRCLNIDFINNAEEAGRQVNNCWDVIVIDLNLRSKHDKNSSIFDDSDIEDIKPALSLIESIQPAYKDRIIVYSSYLFKEEIRDHQIIPLLKPLMPDNYKWEERLIPKTGQYSIDKHLIIDAIFNLITE